MAARRGAANRHVGAVESDRPGASRRTRPAPAATRAVNLDRLIHDRTRLAIISALARKLEDAGYVTCTKGFEGRLPKTQYSLNEAGHRALRQYLDHMEAIIKHARTKR